MKCTRVMNERNWSFRFRLPVHGRSLQDDGRDVAEDKELLRVELRPVEGTRGGDWCSLAQRIALPHPETLLEDCDAILTESRCAEFCTDLCAEARRRGIPVIVDVDRAMSLHEGLLTASSHLVFSSEPLQETADVADDGEALKKIAKLTPSFLAGTRGPRGTIWLDEDGQLQETPAFPVHTVDTLGAGDVFHGAFALAITEGQELRQALVSPPPPQR